MVIIGIDYKYIVEIFGWAVVLKLRSKVKYRLPITYKYRVNE